MIKANTVLIKMDIKNLREDFEKIEELIPERIPKLRKILQGKYNIIVPAHCDKFLARCIRMENGNIEDAIKLVKAFYTATGNFPNWEATFQPSRHIGYNKGDLMITSRKDPEGRLVFIGRTGTWDPDTMTFDQGAVCIWMLIQYITAVSRDAQRNGIVTIWDFTGLSMKHIWAANKWRVPYLAKLVQSHTVGTINEFHAINHPKIFRIFFSSFVKPFLRESLQKWIFFHDNLESLHSHFDKSGLPAFLGGDQEVEECMDRKLMNNFLRQDQYFADMLNDRFPRY